MSQALLPAITPEAIESIFAIAFGFAIAGLSASGYRLFRLRFPSFRLLEVGPMPTRFAVVPGAGVLRPVLDHAQHIAWTPLRAAQRRVRDDRHHRRRIVELDVGDGGGDGAASAHLDLYRRQHNAPGDCRDLPVL